MTDWWENLDEIERATWVMVAFISVGVVTGIIVRIVSLWWFSTS